MSSDGPRALYHFTAKHLLPRILTEGITKGKIPMFANETTLIGLLDGYQWLTTSPAWTQEWCHPKYSSLPYDRSAVRLTVKVPDEDKLYSFEYFMKSQPLLQMSEKILGAFGDPENWRIYDGAIPVSGIQKIEFKTKEALAA
jgi:hypothetical protein